MKKNYMLKFILINYGVSLITMYIGLNELIRYKAGYVVRSWPLSLALLGSIVFVFFYIVTFRDEVELGKMKKSVAYFIIGFAPILGSFIFNIINYISLSKIL